MLFRSWQIAEAELTARQHAYVPFVSSQVEYSLLNRTVEAEVVPAMVRYGQSMLPYYPLASGILTGKYRAGQDAPAGTRLAAGGANSERFLNEQNLEVAQRLEAFAPFALDASVLAAAPADALVMHDLPAHRGEEISDEAIESPRSVVFDQAENRVHAQQAVLLLLMGRPGGQ